MTPERYRQIGELFHAALEVDAGERAAFLQTACAGDAELRREVESLIASHDQGTDFIESPALAVAAELMAAREADALVGRTIAHYRVLSLVGAGGMGRVYLAEDTGLGRRVALKLLPEHFTHDKNQVQRFRQEARAASALNHPNILTVHEVGQVDGAEFIVTEYVEGETLRARLTRAPFGVREALDVAAQVADALVAAHAAGIVHRDVKPENVMLRTDGYVKVLDFGLAKLTENLAGFGPAESESPTKSIIRTTPGVVMGTAVYMSPEQARGLQVDARTDIFSLAVVVYEMVAGCLPFEGSTSSDVLVSILSEKEPPPLARFARDVPAELERIVAKALRKRRDERYQTTKDLLLDLKALKQELEFEAKLERSAPPPARISDATASGGQASATIDQSVASTVEVSQAHPTGSAGYFVNEIKRHKLAALVALLVVAAVATGLGLYLHARNSEVAIESIAVLPFVNQNNDPNTEYLSDGLTESIINSLTQLPKLKVIARSSVFRYKGKETDPMTAGHDLGVRAVLTGRMLQRGDDLTISTELVDVRDNKQLWGEQYSAKVSDLLSVQRQIASQITNTLRLKLSGADESRMTKRYTENAEAYQLYLRGRYFWNSRTEENTKRGIDYFRQAIAKDPTYALAYTGLADSYSALVFPIGAVAPREAMPKAREAAMQALAIDSTLAEAHASLAFVKFHYDWDWPGAEIEFKRAIELNPAYAEAHHYYSHYLIAMGRTEESLTESRRCLELEPSNLLLNVHLGWHYFYAHQYDQALDQMEKTVEMDKNFAQNYPWLGLILEQKGRYAEAIAAFQKAVTLFPGARSIPEAELAHAYAVSGNREQAQKIIAELQELAKSKYVTSYQIAAIYAGLGEKDQAFAWMQKAYDERSEGLVNLKVDPRLDNLRSDPRFADLMRRVGL
jgi:serine/threonine protein kinase/Tfp pilus assembly protein PilF